MALTRGLHPGFDYLVGGRGAGHEGHTVRLGTAPTADPQAPQVPAQPGGLSLPITQAPGSCAYPSPLQASDGLGQMPYIQDLAPQWRPLVGTVPPCIQGCLAAGAEHATRGASQPTPHQDLPVWSQHPASWREGGQVSYLPSWQDWSSDPPERRSGTRMYTHTGLHGGASCLTTHTGIPDSREGRPSPGHPIPKPGQSSHAAPREGPLA